jgi:hypothetical protein
MTNSTNNIITGMNLYHLKYLWAGNYKYLVVNIGSLIGSRRFEFILLGIIILTTGISIGANIKGVIKCLVLTYNG